LFILNYSFFTPPPPPTNEQLIINNEHAQSCARTGEGVDATTAARRSAKLAAVGKDASARWFCSGSQRGFRDLCRLSVLCSAILVFPRVFPFHLFSLLRTISIFRQYTNTSEQNQTQTISHGARFFIANRSFLIAHLKGTLSDYERNIFMNKKFVYQKELKIEEHILTGVDIKTKPTGCRKKIWRHL
jgi:hypothetical protein